MSEFKVLMPKMGESVQEATITKWFVKEGDNIKEDDLLFEIATEKVDSEIPSPIDGIISKIHFNVGSVVPVGEVVALIQTVVEQSVPIDLSGETKSEDLIIVKTENVDHTNSESTRFYSPLVRAIAREEKIQISELESIKGSGANGRVQKNDIQSYIQKKKTSDKPLSNNLVENMGESFSSKVSFSIGAEDQIIEMGRVRKLIAEHMVYSVQVSPHVTSVVEADVTNLVLWRDKVKDEFLLKYGEKLTFMPVFIEATAQALREFPMVNASVDGNNIILRGKVNVGIAVSKPDGNLIVPVIVDADKKNIVGLTSALNDIANRARNNKLSPDEINGGTFSITNFGSFRNLIGTPIINQPQVAILATGSIEKKPAVMETLTGDAIVVRHKMFLSLSYDHRIVDGALGGAFLRRIADILEEFDINRKF
jgi:2-oxoglutarate dehydrogenase E2 component (dihydrolipoamide succinyltransferase)